MEPVTYAGCVYMGGIERMRKSDQAVLTLEKRQLSLHRGRRFNVGVRRVWARWSAVTEVTLEEGDDNTKFVFATKTKGPGVVLIPNVEPVEVWEVLYRIKGARELVPDDLREEFAETVVLDDDEDEDEELPTSDDAEGGTEQPSDLAVEDRSGDADPEDASSDDAETETESQET